MKRFIIAVLVLMLVACSSSQFTLYKATEEGPAWRVSVIKKPILNTFVCVINDTEVIDDSFGLFNNNFEKDGTFQGKRIKMAGYRTQFTTTGYDGKVTTDYKYQVRVFIDDKEITKFDF